MSFLSCRPLPSFEWLTRSQPDSSSCRVAPVPNLLFHTKFLHRLTVCRGPCPRIPAHRRQAKRGPPQRLSRDASDGIPRSRLNACRQPGEAGSDVGHVARCLESSGLAEADSRLVWSLRTPQTRSAAWLVHKHYWLSMRRLFALILPAGINYNGFPNFFWVSLKWRRERGAILLKYDVGPSGNNVSLFLSWPILAQTWGSFIGLSCCSHPARFSPHGAASLRCSRAIQAQPNK